MNAVLKMLAMVLMAAVFVAPVALSTHCEDDHAADCATECGCLCHDALTLAFHPPATPSVALSSARTRVTDDVSLGRLSLDDIFRPPASA